MFSRERAVARALENRRRYDQIVALTRHYAGLGDVERTLKAAMVAGNFAWHAPVGILSDPDLERLVVGSLRSDGEVRLDRSGGRGRVLHVLTEAYQIGGHSRMAWRWIERDPRGSDVALTAQNGEIPAPLVRAVERTQGRVFDLVKGFPSHLTRATALRRIIEQAEIVVFHVHPFDTIALAAANLPGPRPPVVYSNHADHTYWLGLGAADLVLNNRANAEPLCHTARAVRPQRLSLLPLPIDAEPRPADRKPVRNNLGVRPQQVVALSVANDFKMSPVWGRGFDDVLRGLLRRCPELVAVLAGPAPHGPWVALQREFPRRVFPLGRRTDVPSLFAAADIYLDAYPVSGGTAVLEAASTGLPVLSLQPPGNFGHVYQADAPGLDPRTVFTDENAFQDAVHELVADQRTRRARGEEARQLATGAHSGPQWLAALDDLYRQAAEAPVADLGEYPSAIPDLDYAATLVPFLSPDDTTPPPMNASVVLGGQAADVHADLFAAVHRCDGPFLQVRVSQGWESHPAWMMRLTALAKKHPRLAASLPFVADDDAQGSRSVAALEPVLAVNGQTVDDCGTLSLDAHRPATTGPAIPGDLALEPRSLDALEALLASPCWEQLPDPVPTGR